MIEAINNVEYFHLQRKLWQAYYDLGMKENVWTTLLSETTTNQSNQSRTYFYPKHIIEKRQKTIANQIQRTISELQKYTSDLEKNARQWQPFIDINRFIYAMNECVKKGQQRLQKEFQYRAELAELDLNDRRSITKFYDLQPNEEQIHLVKRYWQVVANELRTKEEIEKLRKRIYLQRIPSKINKIIDHSIDHIQSMLTNSVLDQDRRTGLTSSYSKTITQYKFDLMALNLNTLENIRRGHQQSLIDLQNKISQTCHNLLQQAIKNRQQTMKKRHDKFLEHTLNTFFDEAPTTVL